jgi:hypothetical protein
MTLLELAQDCYGVLTQLERDIEPFKQGDMRIHKNQEDVTKLTIERVERQIDELRRIHGELSAHAKGT